jgi:hypothetical protein
MTLAHPLPSPALMALLSLLVLPVAAPRAAEPMERASIMLERNATDDDLEIRLQLSGNSDGLANLKVTAPDGRVVMDLRAEQSKIGLRHIIIETPEPARGTGVLQAFPAGLYRISGTNPAGVEVASTMTLSHTLPAASTITEPKADQRDVPATGLVLRWTRVPEIAQVQVVLEHERSGTELRAQLPASVTSLAVPDGFLVAGRTYKVAVGTISRDGNRTFVETEFTVKR